MNFKIVDAFFGAQGGNPYFGLHDEDRDRRRFQTRDEAEAALERDRIDFESRSAATKRRRRSVATKPAEDQWGRRFMNLEIVPAHYKWCINSQDDRWHWQEAMDFDFGPPEALATSQNKHAVFLRGNLLGSVEGGEHQVWSAIRNGERTPGEFVSAYQAAHVLYRAASGANS